MPYLLFLKKRKKCNCPLLRIVGGALWVKAVERFHKDQWQFSCHQIWYKVTLIFYSAYWHRLTDYIHIVYLKKDQLVLLQLFWFFDTFQSVA